MIESLLEIQPLTDEDDKDLTPVDPAKETLPNSKKDEREEKKDTKKPADQLSPNEIPSLSNEELEDEEASEEKVNEKEEGKVEEVKEEKAKKLTKEQKSKVKDTIDFKQMVDALVEDGDWVDFEGRDTIEYSAEVFGDLMKNQAKWQAEKEIEDIKSSMGGRAKELLEHFKNGGKEEDFYQSYQQEEDIESYDTTKMEDAERILRIYGESLDWEKSEIEDYIDTQKDKGEDKFKALAASKQTNLLKVVQEDREQIKAAQVKANEVQKAYDEQNNRAILKEIHSLELPEREKKELEKFQFEYKYQDKQGNKYTEAGKKYSEIVSDPKQYAKLLLILKDFENVGNKTTIANQVKKQQYTWLKKGQELNGTKSSETPEFIQGNNRSQRNIFRAV